MFSITLVERERRVCLAEEPVNTWDFVAVELALRSESCRHWWERTGGNQHTAVKNFKEMAMSNDAVSWGCEECLGVCQFLPR